MPPLFAPSSGGLIENVSDWSLVRWTHSQVTLIPSLLRAEPETQSHGSAELLIHTVGFPGRLAALTWHCGRRVCRCKCLASQNTTPSGHFALTPLALCLRLPREEYPIRRFPPRCYEWMQKIPHCARTEILASLPSRAAAKAALSDTAEGQKQPSLPSPACEPLVNVCTLSASSYAVTNRENSGKNRSMMW